MVSVGLDHRWLLHNQLNVSCCQSGVWSKVGGGLDGPYRVTGANLGAWVICTLNYGSGNSKSLTFSGGNWYYSGSGTQVVYCYR